MSICISPIRYLKDQWFMYQSWSPIFTKEISEAQGRRKLRIE